MSKGKIAILVLVLFATVLLGGLSVGLFSQSATAQTSSTYQELQLFTDVLAIVRRSYVEEVTFKDLVYGAIDGMLLSLDPHSTFMPPEVYQEMKVDTRGEFGGLGIEITMRSGVLTIVAPIEDTPAWRVGLKSSDYILKIDDQYTKEMAIMDAVRLMRGKPGTDITLTIMRDGFDKPRDFKLTREVIKIKSVKSKVLEDGYGYVRLSQFQEHTAADLEKALSGLQRESKEGVKGMVLDLRNNPGGLLDQAVEVVDLFLSEGLIVYTHGREEDAQMKFSARARGTEPDYPLVVLINGGSASASEIVAGALQDHGRAVIMGSQSFGKGSVQTIIPLNDKSGLRLTTALYYTPKGRSIQAKGIAPDILVKPGEVKEAKVRTHFSEKDLKNHFDNEPSTGASETDKSEKGDDGMHGDFQLMRALDLLKGWQVFHSMNKDAA